MVVVARATTGRYQMDRIHDVRDATARNGFIGIYLDVSHNLAKVRVAGSNPVVRSRERGSKSRRACGSKRSPRSIVVR